MEDRHKCPVCGKFEFETFNCFEICEICDWEDDGIQYKDHDYRGGANKMSVNEAREAYKKGEPVY